MTGISPGRFLRDADAKPPSGRLLHFQDYTRRILCAVSAG
jgi:hypothetical protein